MAAIPNIFVKISGLGMGILGLNLSPSSSVEEIVQEIEPLISFLLKTLPLSRCIFASNFPVDSAKLDYQNMVEAYKRILLNYNVSLEDQARFFYFNAIKLYKLE